MQHVPGVGVEAMARRSSQLSESCRHDWREEPRLKSEDEATTAMRPCRRSRNTMARHGRTAASS